MPDIPDQPVLRRIEDIMDRSRQLDNAQPCAEMPPRHRNGADHFSTQFVSKLPELFGLQVAEIGGILDCIEQRRFRSV